MKNFLKNLLQISTYSVDYETKKWIYEFSVLVISIDLFFIEFTISFAYWFTRQSFEARNRWFNEYLESIFEQFELTEAAAPAPKKPKKPATKKAATKKKTTSKK